MLGLLTIAAFWAAVCCAVGVGFSMAHKKPICLDSSNRTVERLALGGWLGWDAKQQDPNTTKGTVQLGKGNRGREEGGGNKLLVTKWLDFLSVWQYCYKRNQDSKHVYNISETVI